MSAGVTRALCRRGEVGGRSPPWAPDAGPGAAPPTGQGCPRLGVWAPCGPHRGTFPVLQEDPCFIPAPRSCHLMQGCLTQRPGCRGLACPGLRRPAHAVPVSSAGSLCPHGQGVQGRVKEGTLSWLPGALGKTMGPFLGTQRATVARHGASSGQRRWLDARAGWPSSQQPGTAVCRASLGP